MFYVHRRTVVCLFWFVFLDKFYRLLFFLQYRLLWFCFSSVFEVCWVHVVVELLQGSRFVLSSFVVCSVVRVWFALR